MTPRESPIHVSLLAIPESLTFPVTGLYESFQILSSLNVPGAHAPPFTVEIVGRRAGVLDTATGLPLTVQRDYDSVKRTDIVIATSMNAGENNSWTTGRHPDAIEWLRSMHEQEAIVCSSCTGVLLVAETGLLDGLDATIHWAYAQTFVHNFPNVRLRLEEVLLTGGPRQEFVMAGATSSWQDLLVYLVTRHIGAEAGRTIGRFMLFQWRAEAQAPFVSFVPSTDHGDQAILDIQAWIEDRVSIDSPLDEMCKRSGMPESTFKRRFKQATGVAPLHYVQMLRVEEAKRHLERSDAPIDEISWQVGYEDPASFRRLFKRMTRLAPGEYRRKFQTPEFASAG